MTKAPHPFYDAPVTLLDGSPASLGDWRGKALLVVNVASHCGYTYQYKGLEALHREYASRGFSVLGFPCNQFGDQEPGDAKEIQQFCSLTYDVTFPIFSKIEVNGPNAHPAWEWLKREQRGFLWTTAVKWNFTKFLVAPDGRVVRRFGPRDEPSAIKGFVEQALA